MVLRGKRKPISQAYFGDKLPCVLVLENTKHLNEHKKLNSLI